MGDKYGTLLVHAPPPTNLDEKEDKCSEVLPIITKSIYFGSEGDFIKAVEKNSTSQNPLAPKAEISSADYWRKIENVFYFGFEEPIIPDSIQLAANCSLSNGETVVYEYENSDSKVKSIRGKIVGKKRRFQRILEQTEMIKHYTYSFDNGYKFKYTMCVCDDMKKLAEFLTAVVDILGKKHIIIYILFNCCFLKNNYKNFFFFEKFFFFLFCGHTLLTWICRGCC